MKKFLCLFLLIVLWGSCSRSSGWKLVWEENFDGSSLDTAVWSRIPRGAPDWQNTQ